MTAERLDQRLDGKDPGKVAKGDGAGSVMLRDRDLLVLRGVFELFPWIKEVRVFGSRATGSAKRASDVDLAVSTSVVTATQWSDFMEHLEEAPIIYEIDVVRMDRVDVQSTLGRKIERDGVVIYGGD